MLTTRTSSISRVSFIEPDGMRNNSNAQLRTRVAIAIARIIALRFSNEKTERIKRFMLRYCGQIAGIVLWILLDSKFNA